MFASTVVLLVLCEAGILYFVMIDCWAVGESVIEGRGGFYPPAAGRVLPVAGAPL